MKKKVYILRFPHNGIYVYYIGSSKDIRKRLYTHHNINVKGAKYHFYKKYGYEQDYEIFFIGEEMSVLSALKMEEVLISLYRKYNGYENVLNESDGNTKYSDEFLEEFCMNYKGTLNEFRKNEESKLIYINLRHRKLLYLIEHLKGKRRYKLQELKDYVNNFNGTYQEFMEGIESNKIYLALWRRGRLDLIKHLEKKWEQYEDGYIEEYCTSYTGTLKEFRENEESKLIYATLKDRDRLDLIAHLDRANNSYSNEFLEEYCSNFTGNYKEFRENEESKKIYYILLKRDKLDLIQHLKRQRKNKNVKN